EVEGVAARVPGGGAVCGRVARGSNEAEGVATGRRRGAPREAVPGHLAHVAGRGRVGRPGANDLARIDPLERDLQGRRGAPREAVGERDAAGMVDREERPAGGRLDA